VGRRVQFAGWLVTGKIVHTRNGDPMEFLTFEDETGIVETTFFPAVYRRFCHRDRSQPALPAGRESGNELGRRHVDRRSDKKIEPT
jgi:DNA polymerase III alpha subunit